MPGVVGIAEPARLGTTNAIGYGLTVASLDLPQRARAPFVPTLAQAATQAPAMGIEYLEEMEVYPIPWLKRPLRISLPGWRGAIIALPLVIALIIGGLLAWLLLTVWLSEESARTIFRWTVLAGTIAGCLPGSVTRSTRSSMIGSCALPPSWKPHFHWAMCWFLGVRGIIAYCECYVTPRAAQSVTARSRSRRDGDNTVGGWSASALATL